MAGHPVQEFLLSEVEAHPRDLVPLAVARFAISRQAVHHHLAGLLRDGLVGADGRTQARRYRIAVLREIDETLDQASMRRADEVWQRRFDAGLEGVAANVRAIARFGFTEVVRNALEHSGASELSARLRRTAVSLEIRIADRGSGIFSGRAAALEIVQRESSSVAGRGLPAVARAFDSLLIAAGNEILHREEREGRAAWRLESIHARVPGTTVGMRIGLRSSRTLTVAEG